MHQKRISLERDIGICRAFADHGPDTATGERQPAAVTAGAPQPFPSVPFDPSRSRATCSPLAGENCAHVREPIKCMPAAIGSKTTLCSCSDSERTLYTSSRNRYAARPSRNDAESLKCSHNPSTGLHAARQLSTAAEAAAPGSDVFEEAMAPAPGADDAERARVRPTTLPGSDRASARIQLGPLAAWSPANRDSADGLPGDRPSGRRLRGQQWREPLRGAPFEAQRAAEAAELAAGLMSPSGLRSRPGGGSGGGGAGGWAVAALRPAHPAASGDSPDGADTAAAEAQQQTDQQDRRAGSLTGEQVAVLGRQGALSLCIFFPFHTVLASAQLAVADAAPSFCGLVPARPERGGTTVHANNEWAIMSGP